MKRIVDVRYWHLADIPTEPPNVRFRGLSGHGPDLLRCPLMTHSGHCVLRLKRLPLTKNTLLTVVHCHHPDGFLIMCRCIIVTDLRMQLGRLSCFQKGDIMKLPIALSARSGSLFGSALSPNLVGPPANADVFSFNTGNVTDSRIDPSPRPSPRKSGEREK